MAEQGCEHVSRRRDGLPNQWPGSQAARKSASIASWNARALFCGDALQNHRKMRAALGVCSQADMVGIQETHGALPDAIEFARLAGGSKCFSAWSAVGMEVVVFSDVNLVCGSSSAPGVCEYEVHFEGERDTYDLEKGVRGHESESEISDHSASSCESGSSSTSTQHSSTSSQKSTSSGGVFNNIKREAFSHVATCKHWAIIPGRCLVSLISDGNKSTTFTNMHFLTLVNMKHALFVISFNNKTTLPNMIR